MKSTIIITLNLLFPEKLWTKRFTAAWLTCFISVIAFDVVWCSLTTFRGMSFVSTYVNAFLLALLLALPTLLCPRRQGWQLALLLLFDVLAVCNFIYCRTYFNAIPLSSYALVGNVLDFTSSITDSLNPAVDLLLPLIAVIGTVITCRRKLTVGTASGLLPYLCTVAVALALSAGCALGNGGFLTHVANLRNECYYATTPAVIYTPFGNLLADALTDADTPTDDQLQLVNGWLDEHSLLCQSADTTTAAALAASAARRDNVVFIICESLESWPIGAAVDGADLTPNLNRFVADSTTFYAPHVLSQVGNGRSIDGQLLMLAGMYPTADKVYAMFYPNNRYYALPDAMKQRGAATYLFSGDKPSTWNQGLIGQAFGIDNLLTRDSWDNSDLIGNPKRLSDESLFAQAEAKLRTTDIWPEGSKCYLQVVTYSCHSPFYIPVEKRHINVAGNKDDAADDDSFNNRLTRYITAVNYTDHAIGRFISYLKSRSDWQRTMVVIVGDHEALASWRQGVCSDPHLGHLVATESFIPFIVLNSPVAGRHEGVMGQVDVYSTVMQLLNADYKWKGMGFSALQPDAPQFAIDFFGKIVGDTTATAAMPMVNHVNQARSVSNVIINYNLLE
jgi:phosphoglycerol transferase MdoB-like AlkP superfamily enzyme